ncbi:MFS transporter [Amnibacterium sp. CER49]|uniref:MFS transporter n=1 Tax=Amnibacterium sp. CER49 TaxID=3039161 RepID=UPI002446D17A|nr:MFS transporter [Amnibacterium sp. CER49]MDH2444007.1 MFS transporter [Amnibacterium sp. CER49]
MPDTLRARPRWALPLLVAAAFFMENLDGTILSTAAPAMGRDLGVPAVQVGAAITAYLLTVAVLIPLSGWLPTRFGARSVFVAAVVVFTVASAGCAAAPSLPVLLVLRVLQGAGGALMVPVGRLAVLAVTERRHVVSAIAWLTWPALAAPVVAPLLGGLLVTVASWRWIFLINLPFGVVVVIAALALVPAERGEDRGRLDVRGLLLTAGAIAAVTVLGSLLAGTDVDVPAALVAAGAGVVLAVAATVSLLRSSAPLFDLRILRVETFRVTHAGGSLFRLAVNGVPFLVPLLLQLGFGWSAVQAGATVLWLFVGNLAIKPVTTPVLARFGFKPVVLWSSAGVAASIALLAVVGPDVPVVLLVLLLVAGGAARSIGFTAYNTIAFADVERAELVHANTLSSTVQQLAAGLGVSVAAVALRLGQAVPGAGDLLPYRIAFLVLALLTLGAVVEGALMSPSAGDRIRPAAGRRAAARSAGTRT